MSKQTPGKPVIGIVGGIGAGKSTVAAELVRLGCPLVDGDAVGHALLAEEDVRSEVRERWGQGAFAPDGSVDREALARIVFSDAGELEALNRILHPRIRKRMQEQIARSRGDPSAPAVVVDAAVLFEAGWDDLCTHLVFVEAPGPARARRARQARGWEPAVWRSREKMQISLDKKAARCHHMVRNSSSVGRLREQVRGLFSQIVHAADCLR